MDLRDLLKLKLKEDLLKELNEYGFKTEIYTGKS